MSYRGNNKKVRLSNSKRGSYGEHTFFSLAPKFHDEDLLQSHTERTGISFTVHRVRCLSKPSPQPPILVSLCKRLYPFTQRKRMGIRVDSPPCAIEEVFLVGGFTFRWDKAHRILTKVVQADLAHHCSNQKHAMHSGREATTRKQDEWKHSPAHDKNMLQAVLDRSNRESERPG